MALKILGAGFGRTGTLSLKLALEKLGFGPCYHMSEVFQNPGHADRWAEAIDAPNSTDWEALLSGYVSAVDWPSTYFWKELAAFYPEAKVILTERSPESWYKSCKSTIFQAISPEPDNSVRGRQQMMARKMVIERTFGGGWEDEAHVISVFQRHNEEVRRTIEPGRLLVYSVGEGWEPLCRFLGVPVPAFEFPKVNSTEEFRARAGLNS